tara:strand:+ start:1145 stop:1636 length:492 start_codon:yes stop_codon:yes gene_type:complete
MSEKTLEVIRGLAQAAASSYDGALDKDGKPITLGLKREEGDLVIDTRQIDGFKVRFGGPVMTVTYQSDIQLKDVYGGNFENDIESTFGEIVKYLKKEYKKITGKPVSLNSKGDADILVQETSRVRVFVTAHKNYDIGDISDVKDPEKTLSERLESKFRTFLDL